MNIKTNFQSNILRSLFHGFKNSLKFYGIASRSEFITFYLGLLLLSITAVILVVFLNRLDVLGKGVADVLFNIILGFLLLGYMSTFSLIVRRLYDIDRPLFYFMLYLFPIVSLIFLMVLCFVESYENPLNGSKPNHYPILPMDLILILTPFFIWIVIEICEFVLALNYPPELRTYSIY